MISQKIKLLARTGITSGIVIGAICICAGLAYAQSRSGSGSGSSVSSGTGSVTNTASYVDPYGLVYPARAVLNIVTSVIPIGILAYYHNKMKVKDMYEAAWVAMGWCAAAYIIRL